VPDIIDYWRNLGASVRVHPDDELIFAQGKWSHSLELSCVPVPFYGPLKTAPVVLLYLNPGLTAADLDAANDEQAKLFWFQQRRGEASLRSQVGLTQKSWWVSRTKCFQIDPEVLRHKLAVLELCAYHSRSFTDAKLLDKLPSCRASLQWAQTVLFPAARQRRRVVICLRAAKRWGLVPGTTDGHLFAPLTTRSGHMHHNAQRIDIIAAVKGAVS
jgi:hypothetical protein